MLEDPTIKQEVIKTNYDDLYIGYFGATWIIKLVEEKYY
jgi:hypothetical protein